MSNMLNVFACEGIVADDIVLTQDVTCHLKIGSVVVNNDNPLCHKNSPR